MLSRRVRGFLGVMTMWGVAFSAVGTATFAAVILSGALPDGIGYRFLPIMAVRGFLTGAVSGALFAALLVGRKRSQNVASLSMRRVTVLGFLGGATLPLLTMLPFAGTSSIALRVILTWGAVSGIIGSGIAASIILIARRAPRLPSEGAAPELPRG